MKIFRITHVAAVTAIAALVMTGCAVNETAGAVPLNTSASDAPLTGTISGAGASTQSVPQQSWAAMFQTTNPETTVNYDPVGSGSGREQFQKGAVPFAGTDDAFTADAMTTGTFSSCADDSSVVQVPVYVSPIALTFNLDSITTLNLDPATIAGIFSGAITAWNDSAIRATNPAVQLPATAISPVHRSDKSGTTGNFTDYLSALAPSVWTYGQVEEWPLDGGEAAQGTSGVISAVRAGTGTIGYADASQVTSEMGLASVQVGDEFVMPSADAAAIALEVSPVEDGRGDTDLTIALDRTTTEPGAYPLILASYMVACQTYPDEQTAALVEAYFSTVIGSEGQSASAADAGSAPLPVALTQKAQAIIDTISGS